ncbi:PAS domain-containing protein [Glacieibacterium frigidum]|uniref:histidine kinase n=1 Tax=Glacieibacterium frigidum TaxID=2593303 RepID=A0A552U7R5_9SPHN|nr:PAS domain-containing protein [Glacieibacterium frigidum]TRW14262.1 PAS domain S-box protein [Glacieibacterium frigidum]
MSGLHAHPTLRGSEPMGTDAELAADFRALFGNADIGIAQIDIATRRFVAVNGALCAMLAYDRATLLEKTSDLVHQGDVAARDDLYAGLTATGTAQQEARLIGGDGRELWVRVHATLVTDPDGETRRAVNLIYDLSEQHAAAQRAAEEAERSHLALAAAQAGTWEYRYDPPEMLWSDEVFALYDRDRALGPADVDEWLTYVHPDDRDAALRLGRETEADFFTGEFRVRTAAGGWRWLATRARVVRGPDGKRQRIVGIKIDLTTPKAAEAARDAASARFAAAVAATEGVVWTNDAEGRMIGDQPGWSALTGQTPAEYEGFGWAAAVHPDDAQRSIDAWNASVAARRPYFVEHRVCRHDGIWRDFAVRAIPTLAADGSIREWVGVHTDVTEQRAAERALRDLNATLEARVAQATLERDSAWSNSRDILLILDKDGVVTAANPAWTATLGWPVEAIVGRHYTDFVVTDGQSSSAYSLGDAAHGPLPAFEKRYRHQDGSIRWISWVAAPAGDAIYASGRDVTADKANRIELERAQAQVQEMRQLESMGQLTGGVAHDFNNLLTPIIGSLDVMQRRGGLDERSARLVEGALTAADRAKTLVQRLLAFARRQQLRAAPTDLPQLVDGMRDLIVRSVGPNVAVAVDAAPDLPPAQVDAAQLELALLNLALNARDAMPGGGVLTLAIAAETPPPEAGLPARPYLKIGVADTGEGMDETTRKRAIEPFFSTRGVGRGTGLGLSMVHGLAAQSDGRLELDSEPGAGTVATLWLPIAASAPVASAGPAGVTLEGRTVLLVDDEPLVRATTAAMLADLGLTVVEADGAAAALRLLGSETTIDMLVTDYLMPETNGAELARAAQGLRPGLPAMLVTGYADARDLDLTLPSLGKPFRQAELAAAVTRLIG